MTAAERKALIASYKAGYQKVVAALRGIRPTERDWRPAPGEWSAREVVHHLADSETISGIRLRRILAEDKPLISGYDQDEYARRFCYQERPMEPALEAFKAARATTAQLLDRMSDADWQRAGTHSESGPYPAERWLEVYAEHAEIHAAQIRANRAAWVTSRTVRPARRRSASPRRR
jgi:DinB superfamily